MTDRSFTVDDGLDPFLKEGVYRCKLDDWETKIIPMFGNAQKLVLHFSVIDYGEYFGTKLRAFYNVTLKGKAQRFGGFKPGKRSKFMIDFCNCFPYYKVKRADRIPMSLLENAIIKVRVVTVKKNREQVTLPEALLYSVVKCLEGTEDP